MTQRGIHRLIGFLLPAALLCLSTPTRAVTTRVWVSTTFGDFNQGKGKGVLVTSAGRLVRGQPAKRQQLKGVSMVFAMLEADGAVYLGTGDRGELWMHKGAKTRKLATLKGAVLVTCLARGPAGVVYAGTLPEGRIFAIRTATGQVTPFAQVKADHVWGLHYQARTRTLFAATGPSGKLFAINAAGRARVHWSSKEKHLLALAQGPGGALYVGTAPNAIIYRIVGPGRARAIHDFDGTEIRALAGSDRVLYAAVNKIQPDRTSSFRPPPRAKPKGTPIKIKGRVKYQQQLPRLGAKKGTGGVFALDIHGAATQLHAVKKSYFTALERLPSGVVYAAEGVNGRVTAIFKDRSLATAFKVKERQVLALSMGGRLPAFATGDGASIYRVGAGRQPSQYESTAYNTTNTSRFGVITWRATGRVTVHTRTGNTAKPDKGWSPWRRVAPRGRPLDRTWRGRVGSPQGRYLQFRITWAAGSQAVVSQVRVHFTPRNRAPQWTSLSAGGATTGKSKVVKANWISKPTTAAPTHRQIKWKVKDPDGDPLIYRTFYRAMGDVIWKKIGTKPFHTSTSLKWRTDTLPDGWYEIKVVASDERTNSWARSFQRSRVVSPVLVDHNKPDLVGVKVNRPWVSGLARDSFSRITGIAYSIDGRRWYAVDASDGNFDQEAERFRFRIRPTLKPGIHTLLVRAHDAAGNAQVVKRTLRVR